MYIVCIWPTGVAGVPPERLFSSTFDRFLPSAGVWVAVYLRCLTTLVMGGKGLI